MPRSRWSGSLDEVVADLIPVVKKKGKVFVKYDESEETNKAKMDHKLLISQQAQLHPLLSRHKCWKKSTLIKICEGLLGFFNNEKPGKKNFWKLTKAQQEDWLKTMSNRLMNMISTCRIAEGKTVKWIHRSTLHPHPDPALVFACRRPL